MRTLLNILGTDGLLHILVCLAVVLATTPIIGLWWAIALAVVLSLAKEAWDFFKEKDNTLEQVLHDLICDAIGVAMAVAVVGAWGII